MLDAAHRGDPAALAQLLRLCQPDMLASQDTAGLRVELIRALESLPADYLNVVLLRDFAELSIAEIAAETGDTVAAVKSRLHRARQLAREYLIG